MKRKRIFPIMIILAICLVSTIVLTSQVKNFKGKITDSQNNQYSLSNITIAGETQLRCRLKETLFKLDFDKIQSFTLNTAGDSPFKGYFPADIVLLNGSQSRIYVNIENYWIEGIEENFNIRLKVVLTELTRVDFAKDENKPTPSPSVSPVPTTSPTASPTPSPTTTPSSQPNAY